MFPLTSIDPQGLRVFTNHRDILCDLFIYLNYIGERSVRRMTRSNEIPRADMQKIAKLLGSLTFEPGEDEIDASQWINFIDSLAYLLNLVQYNIKGEYRGLSSSGPTFIENYITVNTLHFQKFYELAPIEQEKRILEVLKTFKTINIYGIEEHNEFFHGSVLSELDFFDQWGSATGVIPLIKFSEIRQFLLDHLAKCSPGVWYSTASFIAYLKNQYPYFLIPAKIPPPDRWEKKSGRYVNFREGSNRWGNDKEAVPDDAPDAFERVEGRYVERFLENVPLLMRFVDAAYDSAPYEGLFPQRGVLKAFRVNERFLRLMSGEKFQPRITIQPNFDVVIESDFYPVKIIREIAILGEPVSESSNGSAYVGIFQLKKTRVAAELARQPGLDVIGLLKQLSGRDLPPNVQIELDEWAGHAEQFTLYEGFALLEGADTVPVSENYFVERITPTLRLVRNVKRVYSELEMEGYVPLRVRHLSEQFMPIAETITSVFPKEPAVADTQNTVRHIKISRTVSITVVFPNDDSFDSFCKMLAELRCPFQSDPKGHSITFDQKYQPIFDEAVQKLAGNFVVDLE